MTEAAGATVMHDSLGLPNNGVIPPSVHPRGGYYRFTGAGSVVVPNQGELNPGTRNFDIRVTFVSRSRRRSSWSRRVSTRSPAASGPGALR